MNLNLNGAEDLSKMLEAHKAVKKQINFLLDARTEALQAVTTSRVFLPEFVNVHSILMKEFIVKGYTREEAVKCATDLVQSPLVMNMLNLGI